jgi:hypothetical protein
MVRAPVQIAGRGPFFVPRVQLWSAACLRRGYLAALRCGFRSAYTSRGYKRGSYKSQTAATVFGCFREGSSVEFAHRASN